VFHNLASLGPSVEKVVEDLLSDLQANIVRTLDTSIITSSVNAASAKKGDHCGKLLPN